MTAAGFVQVKMLIWPYWFLALILLGDIAYEIVVFPRKTYFKYTPLGEREKPLDQVSGRE